MSATPLIDAARLTEKNGCITTFKGTEVVTADFARGLERELAEAKERERALLADKARLDFLDSQVWPDGKRTDYTPPIVQLVVKAGHDPYGEWVNVAESARAAIDAAMKSDSQPK